MKKILLMILLSFTLVLVACTGDNEGDKDNEPTAQEIFDQKFEFLEANNYDLEIKIRDHQTLSDTVVQMSFDGTKIRYVDADYIAYYDNSGAKSKMYVKQGDEYVVSESNFKSSSLLYYGFEFDQFDANGDTMFIMKSDQYSTLDSFIGLEDGVTSISSLQVRVDENHLTQVIFDITVGETVYLVTLTISNIGQVSLVLPA